MSLTEAVVPSSLKNASLHPLLKKASLPYDEFSSFRPVSNLSFISKCVKKVAAAQTCMHIDDNNLSELYQSAYKKHHSTETALIKVQDDILRAIDNNCCVILLLLDLSAAFDTVDHRILLDRLSERFSIIGNALEWFRSYLFNRHQVVKVNSHESTSCELRCGVARNFGVIYDSSMSMENHIMAICKAAFYHLRNISRIRKYLSSQTAEMLVHAFVSSRLDYCNSLLYGLPKELLKKLQHVQNVAARIVTHTRKCDHITPVLCQLHWLPIEERIVFKILSLTFKYLNGLAPPYLRDLIAKYVPRRNLRSINGHHWLMLATNLLDMVQDHFL